MRDFILQEVEVKRIKNASKRHLDADWLQQSSTNKIREAEDRHQKNTTHHPYLSTVTPRSHLPNFSTPFSSVYLSIYTKDMSEGLWSRGCRGSIAERTNLVSCLDAFPGSSIRAAGTTL